MADVVACTQCGGMIEPMEDAGIIPMLVTHASFKGPIFHLAYFCCEKCLKAFVEENANGAISSISCVVLPEEADMSILEDLPKLVLAPVMQQPDESSDFDKLFEDLANDMYEGGEYDEEYDGNPDWWEDDDEEEY